MRNLTRLAQHVFRLLGRDDRGATLAIVAIFIASGVLVGIGALAIDVGRLYQNRAELQNGADAGALAVAKSCISGTCNTALNGSGVAQPETTANASALTGGNAGVDQILICLSGQSCTTPPGCPGPPAGGKGYVDVRTSTLLANGSTLLPPVFARALLGNSGYPGTNVKACAQAEWGPALQADSIAMTMSYCAWNAATNGGTTFGPNVLSLVYLKNSGNSTCFGPAGSVPGGFDWLSPTASNVCDAMINLTTSTSYSDTGNNTSAACKAALYTDITSYLNGTPVTVYLPVFDAVSGTGGNLTYTLVGMAGFVPVGYSDLSGNPGDKLPKAYGNQCPASPNDPCVKGYFTQALDPVTTIGSGTNYGAEAAKLTG